MNPNKIFGTHSNDFRTFQKEKLDLALGRGLEDF
jgi:hypothetical protein